MDGLSPFQSRHKSIRLGQDANARIERMFSWIFHPNKGRDLVA
jgi:hypothetical protein